jgi:endonuclease/exonuclease/phosphatase family metal-dependent hydrolase
MSFSNLFAPALRIITVVFSTLLILSCLHACWIRADIVLLDLLALLIPYVVGINLFLTICASVQRSKILFLPLVALVLWFFTLGPFLVFSSGDEAKAEDQISLLSYNVLEFVGNNRGKPQDTQEEILDFVLTQDSDIICFQEFASTKTTRHKLRHYPYQFIYSSREGKKYSPMAVFSKYPIVSSGSLDFTDTFNNTIYTDLKIGEDTIRVYNIHLQSLRFRPGSIKRENTIRLSGRLGKTIRTQKRQAEIIDNHRRKSPYPTVICGDFNNTQFSRVYQVLKENHKDSFLEKGNGFGTTLLFKFLPFRIDYILVDSDLEVIQHKNFKINLSDHEPIMASFRTENP